ncbi:MAG: HAMP domain-containing histidine kinase [Bacteroidetes bacterium]|nr:HAMP domain-containing histidine kinase [Bacteroidota bacterium]
MLINNKFSYVNIDKETFAEDLNKKGAYYANVVMWTILFSLPLFWLLDYLFLQDNWTKLFVARLLVTVVTYAIYIFSKRINWPATKAVFVFIMLHVIVHSFVCGVVPLNSIMAYFLVFSVFMLLINVTLFWSVHYPIFLCLLSYIIIILLFSAKGRIDKYELLVNHGGIVYFILSGFSCLVAYNRYVVLRRDIARNILINEANNKVLLQNEKINDQKYVIEDANRKLKTLNNYRHNTMNILLNDFKNFTGSIEMSLGLLHNNSENITGEQKEILNYIQTGNQKLKYLSEKLANSADRDEAKVDFNYERFDVGPVVEQAVMDIASDAAQMKQINLQLHLAPMAIMVYLDKLFFTQVLFKLLNNALRHAQSGSIITIHTNEANNDKCIIEVINVGKLVGKNKMDELFNKLQPYKPLANAVADDADMGFAVAKKLTETMGGTFTYNSNQTTGNYYRIEFNRTH